MKLVFVCSVVFLFSINISHSQSINQLDDYKQIFQLPLDSDDIEIVCSQMNFGSDIKTDLDLFNQLIQKKDTDGRSQSKALEHEAIHNSPPRLSAKFEQMYQKDVEEMGTVFNRLMQEMGSKNQDFIQWVKEENFIRALVWSDSNSGWKKDESFLEEEALNKIENSNDFKKYKENKIQSFSSSSEANSYFEDHELSLRKRILRKFDKFNANFKKAIEYKTYQEKLDSEKNELESIKL